MNPYPVNEPPFFKTFREWVKGAKHTVPEAPVDIMARRKAEFVNFPQDELRLTWIGHSTVLLEIDGVRLLIDPIWSKRSSPFSWIGPKRFHLPPLAMADLPSIDATLVEIGAYNRLWADMHLGPEQAVEAVKRLQGGLLVPVHWATFDLAMHSWVEPAERLILAARQEHVPIAIPRPGQSVMPAEPFQLERWWPDLPWQTADEHPVVSSGLIGNAI